MRSFVVFMFILFSFGSMGETASEKGYRLTKEAKEKNEGYVGEESSMEMVLITASGDKVVRKMKGLTLEGSEGDKTLLEFINPKDVKGTKLLTHGHDKSDDDQWLYLPSFRRVKRITSSGKSSSFMGSEFSFEDLSGQGVEKYNYSFIGDEKKEGHDVWVIDRTSKDKSSYSKQRVYLSKKVFNPVYIEYFDRRGELLKYATFSDYPKYQVGGKEIYRPGKIHMKNVQTKKESIFTWSDRKIGKKIPSRKFNKSKLK